MSCFSGFTQNGTFFNLTDDFFFILIFLYLFCRKTRGSTVWRFDIYISFHFEYYCFILSTSLSGVATNIVLRLVLGGLFMLFWGGANGFFVSGGMYEYIISLTSQEQPYIVYIYAQPLKYYRKHLVLGAVLWEPKEMQKGKADQTAGQEVSLGFLTVARIGILWGVGMPIHRPYDTTWPIRSRKSKKTKTA